MSKKKRMIITTLAFLALIVLFACNTALVVCFALSIKGLVECILADQILRAAGYAVVLQISGWGLACVWSQVSATANRK